MMNILEIERPRFWKNFLACALYPYALIKWYLLQRDIDRVANRWKVLATKVVTPSPRLNKANEEWARELKNEWLSSTRYKEFSDTKTYSPDEKI